MCVREKEEWEQGRESSVRKERKKGYKEVLQEGSSGCCSLFFA
jgi:hypothetical protein